MRASSSLSGGRVGSLSIYLLAYLLNVVRQLRKDQQGLVDAWMARRLAMIFLNQLAERVEVWHMRTDAGRQRGYFDAESIRGSTNEDIRERAYEARPTKDGQEIVDIIRQRSKQ
jgi:hypothetical protein